MSVTGRPAPISSTDQADRVFPRTAPRFLLPILAIMQMVRLRLADRMPA